MTLEDLSLRLEMLIKCLDWDLYHGEVISGKLHFPRNCSLADSFSIVDSRHTCRVYLSARGFRPNLILVVVHSESLGPWFEFLKV
jgi:hypothetical protein